MIIELELIDDILYTKNRTWAVLTNLDGVYFLYRIDPVGFYQFQGIKDKDLEYIKEYIGNHLL